MGEWEGVPYTSRSLITALCRQGNADIRIGERRWVSCWVCGEPVEYGLEYDYWRNRPVCSVSCERDKEEHYR